MVDATRRPDGPESPLPPVLTPERVAALLGLASREEALKLARRRELPSVKFGKRVLFLLESVLATLKLRERPAIEDRDLGRDGPRGRVR